MEEEAEVYSKKARGRKRMGPNRREGRRRKRKRERESRGTV